MRKKVFIILAVLCAGPDRTDSGLYSERNVLRQGGRARDREGGRAGDRQYDVREHPGCPKRAWSAKKGLQILAEAKGFFQEPGRSGFI